ncbi:unnamed protein product (macronuclear) [Paramecium tetraurelia]|uniref:Thioredoxin-like fold domain-containing protein n=1 Tax=Paramecium tetraurelia TaxID=5888 RepID=A0D637_PARTE|nr:uncharacterized protein GSPATT00013934001 [Paramecium tetraurelia]CAK78504.1 unnamed protein product [Paramecium tetraurelia]|eukprot:XP_001445901.1 hypothetical protein (macronuclear) [Paramecium tetraurelia strain d4-2]
MFTLKKYLYDIAYGQRKVKNRLGIVVMLISGYAGYNIGTNQSEKLDTSSLYQFNGQDEEIYNLLQTKPVLQLIYPPGEPYFDNYRTAFIKASNKFNQVHFVLVNTNQHFQYCRNIDLSRLPQGLLWLPQNFNLDKIEKFKQEGVFPVVEYLKEYSVEGIECFLMQNGVIPEKKSTDKLTQQIKPLM